MLDSNNSPDNQPKEQNFPLLYEMIRSFTALAKHLNLSHAVKELGSTRQTVRRHINQLEDAFGEKLFTVNDRRYELTRAGLDALEPAQDIQSRASGWITGKLASTDGLQRLQYEDNDFYFYLQQQPIGDIFSYENPMLREAFRAWSMAGGQIEHPSLQHVRPYAIIYREMQSRWVCVEFGQESWYTRWFGPNIVRSSIGKPIDNMPGGEDFGRLLNQAFRYVVSNETARLDHIFTKLPFGGTTEMLPAAYKRLSVPGYFPDGSLAIISFVDPTNQLNLAHVSEVKLKSVETRTPVEFHRCELKFEN